MCVVNRVFLYTESVSCCAMRYTLSRLFITLLSFAAVFAVILAPEWLFFGVSVARWVLAIFAAIVCLVALQGVAYTTQTVDDDSEDEDEPTADKEE